MLLTCQEQAWGDVQVALLQTGLPVTTWATVLVPQVSTEELSTLINNFPALRSLSFQDHLIPILRQPKILDLLARNSEAGKLPSVRVWAGEPDVIDWIWKAAIESKKPATARQRLLWQLADKQAQQLSVDVALDELSDVADIALDDLEADRICQCKEGRVSFTHDLWGDWSRQRLLLAHEKELPAFIETQLDNPVWHRAIVLLGLDLLERRVKPERWRELLEQSKSLENGESQFCDLLLEALIRAAQTTDALAQAWSQLCDQDGLWLRRLLTRFLHLATSPNPEMLEYARSREGLSETWASSVNRKPKPALWGAMLRFLDAHRETCTDLAPLQTAEVAECWVRWTATDTPLRKQAADLALAVAWQTLRYRQHWHLRHYSSNRYSHSDSEATAKKAYSAVLLAIDVCADLVIDVALCACGRREPTEPFPPISEPDEPEFQPRPIPPEFEAALNFVPPWRKYEIEIPAWQDGPRWPIDCVFREICWKSFEFLRFIVLKPDIAAEITLALVIKKGGTRLPESDYQSTHYDFELADAHLYRQPFYDNGPFQCLLTFHPTIGLDTVVKLVNFTTERWRERQQWKLANESQRE
ncbi:hypothetical protein F6R98_21260 [Candidatus Methylospira mobilis]|uniref:Uncharacterized protein n=1 Tax=Candidatus Methylospira mobilis TaxID=1808979 RepID=A0A5Q0BS07_9GAMM|nr:hypothetical protein [Candidatus Methylospira mobilis]QFY44848.1 hypothetical protein F6R98_21260 [Candidatus Methylospira mobilis]